MADKNRIAEALMRRQQRDANGRLIEPDYSFVLPPDGIDPSAPVWKEAKPSFLESLMDRFELNRAQMADADNITASILQSAGVDTPILKKRREEQTRKYNQLRPWYEADNNLQSLAEFGAATAGTLTGSMADPINFVGGVSKKAYDTFARNAGIAGLADSVLQLTDTDKTVYNPASEKYNPATGGFDAQFDKQGNPIETWTTPEFDPSRVLMSMGAGGTLSTGVAGQIPQLGREALDVAKEPIRSANRVAETLNKKIYEQGGKLLPPVDPINGWALTPEEAMNRWDAIRQDSGQKTFPDNALTLDEVLANDNQTLDVGMFENNSKIQGHVPASEATPVEPQNAATPGKMKALATARRSGERRVGKTVWNNPSNFGSPTGYDKTEILHNPNARQVKALSRKAPYGELRWLADMTTGDVHVWPAAHGFHNDAANAMGIKYLDNSGQMIHGYFDDSYPVDFDNAKTIDDLLAQQWKGRDFFQGRDLLMDMTGRKTPHAPGSVNPKSPAERLAAEQTRPPGEPGPSIREEYPGIYTYMGEGVDDPRNPIPALTEKAKGNLEDFAGDSWNTLDGKFVELEPGRFITREQYLELKSEMTRGKIDPASRTGRAITKHEELQARPDMYGNPAQPTNKAAPIKPYAAYAPKEPKEPKAPAGEPQFMTLNAMKREWDVSPGVYPQFTSDNAITHNLITDADFEAYREALKGEGNNRNWQGKVLADNDLARARRDRMQERARERAFTGKELPDDADMFADNPALATISPNDIERLVAERPDFAGLDAPTMQWLHDEAGWYQSPMRGTNEVDPIFRPTGYDTDGDPTSYIQAGINDIPSIRDLASQFTEQKQAAGSIGEGVAKALMEREAPTGAKLYENWSREQRRGRRIDGGFDRLLRKRYQLSDSKSGGGRITVDDLDNIENMDMSVHNDGEPIYKDLSEPRNVKAARAKMAKGRSRYDDPSMYGEPSGVSFTYITHNPTIREFMDVAKKSPYGEVRYLVDGNGDTHIWPAAHSYHDDAARFMGLPENDNMLHGNMNKNAIDKVMERYQPDNIQQLVFADQRTPRTPEALKSGADHSGTYDIDTYMMDHGINNPVWSFEQARFDNQLPYRRAGDGINAAAKAIDLDLMNSAAAKAKETATAAPEPRPDGDAALRAMQNEARSRTRVRKKGEPSYDPKLGYLERQSKIGDDPLTKADLGDGFNAAASFDGNTKDWSKVPVKNIHADQRAKLIDPTRPIPDETAAPKPLNAREAKKVLTPEEADKVLNERRAVLGQRNEEKVVKATTLGTSITRSVADHAKMSPAERALNLKAAEEVLSKAMGNKKGQVTRLFTKNAKLMKAEKGYDGNWVKDPMKLPNGQGIETTGMALAPSSETRGFKTCPNSASCRDACLGFKAGQYYQGGVDGGPQTASRKRTQAMLDYPDAYGVQMYEEIAAARRTAIKNGNILGVRLNVLSDVDPKVYKSLIEAFPDVWFYDYTKMNYRPIAPNHHVTYSSTGVSNKDVTNLNQNWSRMRAKLEAGDNVAMAFTDKKSIPKFVLDEETGKMHRTVDGVGTDFRPSDLMETDGNEGVIVALKNMEQSTHKGVEHMETAGFLVPYDAKYKREMSKTGKPGKYIRDERGQMIPTSEIAVIPKQVSRKTEREKARVQITVGGKDMSDYGGQSTGYTPDQSTAPAAGMKTQKLDTGTFENDARAGKFVGKNTYNKPDKTAGSSGRRVLDEKKMAAVSLANVRNKFGVGIDPAKVGKRTAAEMLPGIQDQNLPKRPFGYDYNEEALRAQGMKEGDKLTQTMRGTPIEAKHVIGRQTMGGEDIPLPDEALQDIAKYLLEDSPTRNKILGSTPGKVEYYDPPGGNLSKMGTAKGTFVRQDYPQIGLKAGDSAVADILINDLFPADSKNQTLAHELGHGIHYEVANGKVKKFAKGKTLKGEVDKYLTPFREIPTSVKKELREVYHDAHTVSKEQFYHEPSGPRGNISPETNDYSSSATNEELMAEFFVVLRADPNYAKTIAPTAYQWLAEQIDAHPELRKTLQLNNIVGAAGSGLAAFLASQMTGNQDQGYQDQGYE